MAMSVMMTPACRSSPPLMLPSAALGGGGDDKSAIPATAEARAKRLAELKVEIADLHSRYKRHAERTLVYALDMGKRLAEAKLLVGHGPFMQWVVDNVSVHACGGVFK